ncbi:MAG TPA: hypothetical protein VHC48_05445 [Puia sp.]|nr:hypothetical protein [Puia sp.]
MKTRTYILASILFLASSCSNSRITSSWKGGNATTIATGNKILVLGIIREKDIRLRMQMEGFMVDALKAKGYNAVSAYTLYGPKMFGNKDEEAVLNQLRNSGIDEVFTITLLDKARERNFQPGAMYPYSPFWGYYNYWYGRMYNPGYISVDTHFFWESNLYDVGSKKLLYSAQSRSTNPSSAGSMGKDYSKAVIKNMTQQGILART